jgi:hypothetical protein
MGNPDVKTKPPTRLTARSGIVDDHPDRLQRVIRRHELQINIAEQATRRPILAPHQPSRIRSPATSKLPDRAPARDSLSSLLGPVCESAAATQRKEEWIAGVSR